MNGELIWVSERLRNKVYDLILDFFDNLGIFIK